MSAAVGLFTTPEASDVDGFGVIAPGPRRLLSVAGGMVQFSRRNLVRAEVTHARRETRRIEAVDERARIATAAQRWIPTVERLTLRAVELGAILPAEVDVYRWTLLGEFVLRPEPGQLVTDPVRGYIPLVKRLTLRAVELGAILPAEVEEYRLTLLRKFAIRPDADPATFEPWLFEWRRPPLGTRRKIGAWSGKSRARMCKIMCSVDWSPMVETGRPFAMVTLTSPTDWEVVFPSRAAFNAAVERFLARYARAWGEPLRMFWKVEFQERGAVHLHALCAPPHGRSDPAVVNGGLAFKAWLSNTWAECTDPDGGATRAPDEFAKHVAAGTGVDFAEGLRASDPKRAAVYFLGHNSAGHPDGKEYQHRPPALWVEAGSVGRFWGRRGLDTTVATLELSPEDYTRAVRLTRRWSRAQRLTRTVMRPRYAGGRVSGDQWDVAGLAAVELLTSRVGVRPRNRRQTIRVERCGQGAGWVAVNDGPSFAGDIARWLDLVNESLT